MQDVGVEQLERAARPRSWPIKDNASASDPPAWRLPHWIVTRRARDECDPTSVIAALGDGTGTTQGEVTPPNDYAGP